MSHAGVFANSVHDSMLLDMNRYELTNDQWEWLQPLLPPQNPKAFSSLEISGPTRRHTQGLEGRDTGVLALIPFFASAPSAKATVSDYRRRKSWFST